MAFSRYTRDDIAVTGRGLTVSQGVIALRSAIKDGTIQLTNRFETTQADRLDNLAAQFYGDGRYWWVVAAASDIGWGLQVPPGTIISIVDLRAVEQLLG